MKRTLSFSNLQIKTHCLLYVLLLFSTPLLAQYEVKGGEGIPLQAEHNIQNHVKVYLLNGMKGAQLSYTSASSGTHQWYKYNERATMAVPVVSQQSGNTSVITDVSDGYGYFVGLTNDPSTNYIWILDYSKYLPSIQSIDVKENEFKCETLQLEMNIKAPILRYYLPSGLPVIINRTYSLQYNTLEWEEENRTFTDKLETKQLIGEITLTKVAPPLQNTEFRLSGDSFSEHFGLAQSIATPVYQAIAVEAHGVVEKNKEIPDNQKNVAITDEGGSAPWPMTFTAYANEPVAAFYIWNVTKNTGGNIEPIIRYTDKVLRYTFEKSGHYTVQLEVIDAHIACTDTSQVYSITITESKMDVPNAFSPGSSIGINDEFKVSYLSLTKFKCWIFNRWGNKLYEWDDPSKGWDGKVGGQYVPSGVYFYIIQAEGADGIKYNRKGAVNVLRTKQ